MNPLLTDNAAVMLTYNEWVDVCVALRHVGDTTLTERIQRQINVHPGEAA